MSTKPKLYLHIGTHKTGSTAVQNGLQNYRKELAERGILYPDTTRGDNPHLPKHDILFKLCHAADKSALPAEIDYIKSQLEDSGCNSLILSEEGLSEPLFGRLERLKSALSDFDVVIICYFKRPDLFLESLWIQKCREGVFAGNIVDFANAPFNRKRLNYAQVCRYWSELGELRVYNFEEIKTIGAFKNFMGAIGLGDLEIKEPIMNESISANCANLLSALNKSKQPFTKHKVVRFFKEDRTKTVMGKALRQDVLKKSRQQMEKLKTRHGIEFDLTLPEGEAAAPTVDLPPDIVARMFKDVFR